MTISTLIRKTIAAGNGILTAFAFNFQVRSASDLQVYYTDAANNVTLLASNLYVVNLNAVPAGQLWANGGSVTYSPAAGAIAVGTSLTIVRTIALLQSSSLINQGGYYPNTVEQALDLLTMEMQQLSETISRSLTLPVSSSATATLPFPLANAGLGWDPTGTFITNILSLGGVAIPVSVANGGTGGNTAALARTNLGVVTTVVNGLINGGHEIWQRGTPVAVAASSNGYGADRWALTTGINQACTITQAAGLTSGSQFGATVQRTAAQIGVGVLVYEQPFELAEIIKWRGQTITVSALLATGANWSPAGGTLTIAIACGTGAAARRGNAAYVGETQPLSQAFNIVAGSAAASYSATAAAVIPVNTTQMTLMVTWTPVGVAGAADNFTIDDVMFSAAPTATFERRPVAQETALCQRYMCKTFQPATTPAQNVGLNTGELRWSSVNASVFWSVTYNFPVQMLKAPTITTFNPSAANAQARNISLGGDCSAIAAANPTVNSVFIGATDNVGGGQGQSIAVHLTAIAEL